MPMIFHKSAAGWATLPIAAPQGVLSFAPAGFLPHAASPDPEQHAFLLARTEVDQHWVLLVRPGERVLHNGQVVTAGMRVLAHRDCLALEGREPLYFSTEEAARVDPFAGPAAVMCPRCRADILPGEAAVKCPRCGVFHHQREDRPCWLYSPTCACCAQATAFDGELQWTPALL